MALIDPEGTKLGRRRIRDDAAGLGELTGMFAAHGGGLGTVKIAIETERGLLVASLRAAGYAIYPANPKAADRYRDRHQVARNKSDAADAMVSAHILRTDAHLRRPLPAHSPAVRAIEVLARAHQDLVWSRQHEVNRLRSLLAGYYPAAPTPAQAARLTSEDLLDLLETAGGGAAKRSGSQQCSLPRSCASPPRWKPPWARPPRRPQAPSPR